MVTNHRTVEHDRTMNAIAIIPARGGSKRLPRKNILPFRGRPILAWSILAARNSGCFDEVMVSTDDEEVARVARDHGASVPFLRSQETANDFATLLDVVREVTNEYGSRGQSFDLSCCILATAPLIRTSVLRSALQRLEQEDLDSIFPVARFSYPIWRSMKIEDGVARMNWPENLTMRSQDLPPAFHDAGQFYWMRTARCLEKAGILTNNSGVIELSSLEVQDIDTLEDWKLAELKHSMLADSSNSAQ